MREQIPASPGRSASAPLTHVGRRSGVTPAPEPRLPNGTAPAAMHDFGRLHVYAAPGNEHSASVALETFPGDPDRPDDEATLQSAPAAPGGGAGSGGAGGGAGGAPAGGAARTASLSLSGDQYKDGARSLKEISFNATWSGGAKEDYILVNWVRGSMKRADGTPFKAKLYDKLVDIDFSDWRVDSVDPDPAYWSTPAGRWNYVVDGPQAFHAEDSPGKLSGTLTGAKAALDFKTAAYLASAVPTTTTGTIAATPLSSFQPWEYHVEVLAGGKFKHA